MGKKKIIIDTNNLISALGWEGNSRELLRKVIAGEYELFISITQMNELKRVLNYPKFSFTDEQKEKFLKIISDVACIVDTKTELKVVKDDPADDHLIECAYEINADYVISGDKHLKKLNHFKNTRIVSVSAFLYQTSNLNSL